MSIQSFSAEQQKPRMQCSAGMKEFGSEKLTEAATNERLDVVI